MAPKRMLSTLSNNSILGQVVEFLSMPTRARTAFQVNGIVPVVKNLPFFKDRGLKQQAIADTLSLMTYKEVKQDEFVIEFGTTGDEFYLILDGECEVLVPSQDQMTEFKQINFEMKVMHEKLKAMHEELNMMMSYQRELEETKNAEDMKPEKSYKLQARRMTQMIDKEIPESLQERSNECLEVIQAVKRFQWRKNYELMVPVLMLGQGKSFGELAMQKDKTKIAQDVKRKATVLCRTDCKFAVMKKADYQSVLLNVEQRRIEKLKEFFKQIPFLRLLPRSALNHLHLSLRKTTFHHGHYVCREGKDSTEIFIVLKGEFEVSKVVDTHSQEITIEPKKATGKQYLPMRKLEQQNAQN